MISTVTINPALDKTVYVVQLLVNDANRITKMETDAGGKGLNASRILKELGSDTLALGFVGGHTGAYIEHVLKAEGVPTAFVNIAAETRTNICIQDACGSPPTMLDAAGPDITEDEFHQLCSKVQKAAKRSSMVLLGGSLCAGVPCDCYFTLANIIKEAGAKVILDSDGPCAVAGMKAVPFMIKPNRDEVKRLVGVDIKDNDDAIQALKLLQDTGVELVVISMGKDGAIAGMGGKVWRAVPPAVKPISTIGSGDSMVAGIAHVLSEGGSVEDALRWGSAAGAATAMTDGTEIGRRSHILELLDKAVVEQLV